MRKFFEKLLYWVPYVPILGMIAVMIFMSRAGDGILCIDDDKHWRQALYTEIIGILIIGAIITLLA